MGGAICQNGVIPFCDAGCRLHANVGGVVHREGHTYSHKCIGHVQASRNHNCGQQSIIDSSRLASHCTGLPCNRGIDSTVSQSRVCVADPLVQKLAAVADTSKQSETHECSCEHLSWLSRWAYNSIHQITAQNQQRISLACASLIWSHLSCAQCPHPLSLLLLLCCEATLLLRCVSVTKVRSTPQICDHSLTSIPCISVGSCYQAATYCIVLVCAGLQSWALTKLVGSQDMAGKPVTMHCCCSPDRDHSNTNT